MALVSTQKTLFDNENENDKTENSSLSRYDGFDSSKEISSENVKESPENGLFDDLRIIYYGEDWFDKLFKFL